MISSSRRTMERGYPEWIHGNHGRTGIILAFRHLKPEDADKEEPATATDTGRLPGTLQV